MDETVRVTRLDGDPVRSRPIEFVERKGLGHSDTICDGVAEAVSSALSRTYRDVVKTVRERVEERAADHLDQRVNAR